MFFHQWESQDIVWESPVPHSPGSITRPATGTESIVFPATDNFLHRWSQQDSLESLVGSP
jgi:hypothetical protein